MTSSTSSEGNILSGQISHSSSGGSLAPSAMPGPSSDSAYVQRARKTIMTPRLSAALDKCKVSDRDAVHLLSACVESLNLCPQDYVINRTSIRNARITFREQGAEKIKTAFSEFMNNTDFVIIHWDSKMLPDDIGGYEKVERLPIIATTFPDVEQLLGVPKIISTEGIEVAAAVHKMLEKWSLVEKVQGFVFDTTASNTGRFKGACTLLEQKLDREVLWLACRHHIFELVLKAAFEEAKLYISSGPDIALLKRFRDSWKNINTDNIRIYNHDEHLRQILEPHRDDILSFCEEKIKEDFPRDDYKEFIELVIVLLGANPPDGIRLRQPGAYHQARWMAKGIYALKMYLLREEFKIRKREEIALRRICAFIARIYIKVWSQSAKTVQAPFNDLELIRALYEYEDTGIGQKCLKKFLTHLWYLNEEIILFSLFDERVSEVEKAKTARMLLEYYARTLSDDEDIDYDNDDDEETKETSRKPVLKMVDVGDFLKKDFPSSFISESSLNFFKRFKIGTDFLHRSPAEWTQGSDDDFLAAKRIIESILVVNDTAERGVRLFEEFNTKFTKSENQKDFLLQVIQKYRKTYTKSTKSAMGASFS